MQFCRLYVPFLDVMDQDPVWFVRNAIYASLMPLTYVCCYSVVQDTIEQYLSGWTDDDEDEEFSTPINDVSLKMFFYEVMVKTAK